MSQCSSQQTRGRSSGPTRKLNEASNLLITKNLSLIWVFKSSFSLMYSSNVFYNEKRHHYSCSGGWELSNLCGKVFLATLESPEAQRALVCIMFLGMFSFLLLKFELLKLGTKERKIKNSRLIFDFSLFSCSVQKKCGAEPIDTPVPSTRLTASIRR